MKLRISCLFISFYILISHSLFSQNDIGRWLGKAQFKQVNAINAFAVEMEITGVGENKFLGTLSMKLQGSNYYGNERPYAQYIISGIRKDDSLKFYSVGNIIQKGRINWDDNIKGCTKILSNNKLEIKIALSINTNWVAVGEVSKKNEAISDESKALISPYLKPIYVVNNLKISSRKNHAEQADNKLIAGELNALLLNIRKNVGQKMRLRYEITLLDSTNSIYTYADRKNKDGSITRDSLVIFKTYRGFEYELDMYRSKESGDRILASSIYTDYLYLLPSVNFKVSLLDYDTNSLISDTIIKIDALPFITNRDIQATKSLTTARENLLASHFGRGTKIQPAFIKSLDSLALQDRLARCWKSYIYYTGICGVYPNQGKAISILNDSDYKWVTDKARQGDMECLFLLYCMDITGRGGELKKKTAGSLLKFTALYKYPFACYLLGSQLASAGKSEEALIYLDIAYNQGITYAGILKAELLLTLKDDQMNRIGMGLAQKIKKNGNSDAILAIYNASLINTNGSITKNDIQLLRDASKMGNERAMNSFANYYLTQFSDKNIGVDSAIFWLRSAAKLGNAESMLTLGILHTTSVISLKFKDPKSGVPWIKLAAENGLANAMPMLSKYFLNGEGIEKDIIKARYWNNKALLAGINITKQNTIHQPSNAPMDLITRFLEAKPKYFVEEINSDGDVVDTYYEYPNPIEFFFDELGKTNKEYHTQKQEIIDGLEFIMEDSEYEYYGGTASSLHSSDLHLKKGQQIEINIYGEIVVGQYAGTRNPAGVMVAYTTPFDRDIGSKMDFGPYSITSKINHGAFIVKFGETSDWSYITPGILVTVPADGRFIFAVNDKDYIGNVGYFDFELKVKK